MEAHIESEREKIQQEKELREQQEKERQVEYFMFLRLIKEIIRTNRLLDDNKQALNRHRTFSIEESFKLFDINNNGEISINEVS